MGQRPTASRYFFDFLSDFFFDFFFDFLSDFFFDFLSDFFDMGTSFRWRSRWVNVLLPQR